MFILFLQKSKGKKKIFGLDEIKKKLQEVSGSKSTKEVIGHKL